MKKYEDINIDYWKNDGHKGIYGKPDSFMRKELLHHEARLFYDEDLENKTIFEMGFGDASDLNVFKNKYNMKVSGIDINPQIVKNGRSKIKTQDLYESKIEDWFDQDKNTYDYIYSCWSLMSMNDVKMKKLLKQINEHLKVGGKFIFSLLFGDKEFTRYEIKKLTYYSLNEERLIKILPKGLIIKTFLKNFYNDETFKNVWDLGVVLEKIF